MPLRLTVSRFLYPVFLMLASLQPSLAATRQPPIALYDLTYAAHWAENQTRIPDAWDQVHAVATLQGIVNRDAPRLYVRAIANPEGGNILVDDWWLARLQAPGGWLAGRPVETVPNFDTLFRRFRKYARGLVVYDQNVPATSCLASTTAGVDDLIAVRYDARPASLFHHLQELGFKPKVWLVHPDGSPLFTGRGMIPDINQPSTGSAKNDAYRWAIARYIDTGRVQTADLAYYIDAAWLRNPRASTFWNHTLTNHDYFVARRAFFFDLLPWADEPATDDQGQALGTDLATLKLVLAAVARRNAGQRLVHVGGFTPWAFKYTDVVGGKHGGVATEWRFSELLTAYNAYLDADALGLGAMANASFFAHQPLPQYPAEHALNVAGYATPHGVAAKQYVTFYVGDYDSAAWMYQMLPAIWEDPKRGTVPLGWAFNPNLAARFPAAFWYTRKTRSAQDVFVAGDSGAGYINPSLLEAPRPSGLPSATALWEAHCRRWYAQFGIGITGFVIDGNAPPMPPAVLDAYARFSPLGTVAQKVPEQSLYKGMPLVRMSDDLASNPQTAAQQILNHFNGPAPTFHIFRAILKHPSWYADVVAKVQAQRADVAIVDPYTFMALLKQHEAHK